MAQNQLKLHVISIDKTILTESGGSYCRLERAADMPTNLVLNAPEHFVGKGSGIWFFDGPRHSNWIERQELNPILHNEISKNGGEFAARRLRMGAQLAFTARYMKDRPEFSAMT